MTPRIETRLTLRPGRPGTRKLHERYGERLICVRYPWRKMTGIAMVRIENGSLRHAELHWYEAHGIGRRKMKIKRFLD